MWTKFLEHSKNREPIGFVRQVAKEFGLRGEALDLGCGAGIEAKYLAGLGLSVRAIDIDEEAVKLTQEITGGHVHVEKTDATKIEIPKSSCDVIIAWNLLPFISRTDGINLLSKIREGLRKDGWVFLGAFGEKDSWKDKITIYSKSEILNLLPYDLIKFNEFIGERTTASGVKKFSHELSFAIRKASY